VRLVFERDAVRGLADMPPGHRRRLMERLNAIAQDPFARNPNVKPLKGRIAMFRVRQGNWRAIYRLERATQTMVVETIGPRGGIYD
jgi:mRNA interferase RelE/StbE